MKAYIKHISYYLPEDNFTNQEIENLFPGVKNRYIFGKDQSTFFN